MAITCFALRLVVAQRRKRASEPRGRPLVITPSGRRYEPDYGLLQTLLAIPTGVFCAPLISSTAEELTRVTPAVRAQTGHHRRPTGIAQRHLAVSAVEADAAFGEASSDHGESIRDGPRRDAGDAASGRREAASGLGRSALDP